MGFRKISRDLKLAAMRMYDQEILPVGAIINCLQISRRTFYRILDLWITTGDVVRGRPRILHFDDIDYLRRIIRHRPDWFLDELLDLLETNRFISAHFTTIHRELERAGISTKKLKKIALERNETYRLIICGTWLVTHQNNLVSWTRFQKMSKQQQDHEGDLGKAPVQSKKVSLFAVDAFLLKAYSPLME
jgi:transposase